MWQGEYTMAADELASWPDHLQSVLDEIGGPLQRIIVLRETDSTQDAAKRFGAQPGDVITAGRQTAGRGRLGRVWADTADAGVAVTMMVDCNALRASEQLATIGAIAAACAAEAALGRRVGIKWPNDVVVDGRKLAGVLIEQSGGVAMVGVGINVGQMNWPASLHDRAVSLSQLLPAERAATVSRVMVIEWLLRSMTDAMAMDEDALAEAFASRDALSGSVASFRTPAGIVQGEVLQVQPSRGLLVRSVEGEVWLNAATTSVMV